MVRRRLPSSIPVALILAVMAVVVPSALAAFALQSASTSSGASTIVLLGSQSVAGTRDQTVSGSSEAFGYTATASGTATDVTVYLDSGAGVRVGLYADTAGTPGTRLATGSVASNTAGSWVTVSLSGAAQS